VWPRHRGGGAIQVFGWAVGNVPIRGHLYTGAKSVAEKILPGQADLMWMQEGVFWGNLMVRMSPRGTCHNVEIADSPEGPLNRKRACGFALDRRFLLRLKPADANTPEPRRDRVAGSGTGALMVRVAVSKPRSYPASIAHSIGPQPQQFNLVAVYEAFGDFVEEDVHYPFRIRPCDTRFTSHPFNRFRFGHGFVVSRCRFLYGIKLVPKRPLIRQLEIRRV